MGKNSSKWAIGALIAGVAGYVTGILTAPKSGKDTREDLKNAANKARLEAEKKLKEINSDLTDAIDRAKTKATEVKGMAKSELDKATDTASKAKEKVRVMLSAIHEGDAEDPELKKAMKDAKESLKNLENYLRK